MRASEALLKLKLHHYLEGWDVLNNIHFILFTFSITQHETLCIYSVIELAT